MTDITFVRPEGCTDYLCRIPAELVDRYAEWQDVGYARFAVTGENTVTLEFTNDLERIMDPESSDE